MSLKMVFGCLAPRVLVSIYTELVSNGHAHYNSPSNRNPKEVLCRIGVPFTVMSKYGAIETQGQACPQWLGLAECSPCGSPDPHTSLLSYVSQGRNLTMRGY